jgi:hypothetical protein
MQKIQLFAYFYPFSEVFELICVHTSGKLIDMNQIYRNAAKKIANGQSLYACDAIGYKNRLELTYFKMHFRPDHKGCVFWGSPHYFDEAQMARSLALLLMHEIYNE